MLMEFNSKKVLAYQDDILILSATFEEHLLLVKIVLSTLRLNGIKIQGSKCAFFKDEVTYLGHVVSRSGIKKSLYFLKVSGIIRGQRQLVTQMRQFLGTANFQRKFTNFFF